MNWQLIAQLNQLDFVADYQAYQKKNQSGIC
ncbi:hypothetical protein Lepto7376_0109 [[Leptolyngbya] sp. PCC 7376]|nr:hypothetical protein Lepto7376_0109 [[Leptolyngbya] sp. PCC 7376]